MNQLSVVFIGTGTFGISVLKALASDPLIRIPFVITSKEKASGRGMKQLFSPIKQMALANKLIVHQCDSTNELKQKLIQEKPDYILVVSHGEIIKKDVLDSAKIGAINIHGSLLPKYRGASPIQESLLQGDKQTGVTWILMSDKMDTGDIIYSTIIPIAANDNARSLQDKLAAIASQNTAKVLVDFAKNRYAQKQNEKQATYCRKIKKNDGFIDVYKETADSAMRKIRAYSIWPGCYIFWDNKRLKIIQAAAIEQKIDTGSVLINNNKTLTIGMRKNGLILHRVQPESKREMAISDFIQGQRNIPKTIFS